MRYKTTHSINMEIEYRYSLSFEIVSKEPVDGLEILIPLSSALHDKSARLVSVNFSNVGTEGLKGELGKAAKPYSPKNRRPVVDPMIEIPGVLLPDLPRMTWETLNRQWVELSCDSIKNLRLTNTSGLSQRDVARFVGRTQQTISRLEGSQQPQQSTSLDVVTKLSFLLKAGFAEIMTRQEDVFRSVQLCESLGVPVFRGLGEI
jgi:hypothetical protein